MIVNYFVCQRNSRINTHIGKTEKNSHTIIDSRWELHKASILEVIEINVIIVNNTAAIADMPMNAVLNSINDD